MAPFDPWFWFWLLFWVFREILSRGFPAAR
jgi:hypothetical protein